MRVVLTGNHAAAYAALLSRVEVVAAYPITPQTQIVEKLAEFIEGGRLKAKYIRVESEHSAMAAIIGASAAGARTFTATASHGLVYMNEMVFWAGNARLPIVMAIVCRALAPPWNIWTEHTDILAQRDTGWIQFFCEDNQEVLDTVIQAFKIAEDDRVLLPVMVGLDAFILSHTATPVDVPEQEDIDGFLPPRKPLPFILDVNNPLTHSNMTYPNQTMEFRYRLQKAMERAMRVIMEVDEEYGRLTGRKYGGLLDCYRCEDADLGVIVMGSSAGDAKEAIDKLRDEGYKPGVIRIRVFRPFPREELREICRRFKAIAVIDRDLSPGLGGILYTETLTSLYDLKNRPIVQNYIAGLGGRDISVNDFKLIVRELYRNIEEGVEITPIRWIGIEGVNYEFKN